MKAWELFLEEQEKELGEATVKKWLRTLRVSRFDAQNLFLEAKDSFQALWFEEHIRKKIDKSFQNNNFHKIKVHLSLANALDAAKARTKAKTKVEAPQRFNLNLDSINPHFTLDKFFISENNKISLQILTESSEFNPIYIWGPSGVGKTHLLTALTHKWGSEGKKVTYARCETFTEHVVSAIRASQMGIFREAYRNIDVLILDNIDELAHKGATQEELFHTFNTLHLAGKQIVLASALAPGELQFIEPRLVSRFEWGIVLPLYAYTPEERMQILEMKCQSMRFLLHNRVKQFLVETFKSGLKALIQALEAIILRTHTQHEAKGFHSTSLTIPLIKHYLSDLIAQEESVKITPPKIMQAVADYYGIKPEDILGSSQSREVSLPRQMAMYLCRTELKLPYKKIGDLFERDHSTVMSSCKLISALPETEGIVIDLLKKLS